MSRVDRPRFHARDRRLASTGAPHVAWRPTALRATHRAVWRHAGSAAWPRAAATAIRRRLSRASTQPAVVFADVDPVLVDQVVSYTNYSMQERGGGRPPRSQVARDIKRGGLRCQPLPSP